MRTVLECRCTVAVCENVCCNVELLVNFISEINRFSFLMLV